MGKYVTYGQPKISRSAFKKSRSNSTRKGKQAPKLEVRVVQQAKKARSATKTRVKKRPKTVEVKSTHNDMHVRNLGSVVIGRRYSGYKSLGNYTYRNTNGWVVTGLQGVTGLDFPEVIATHSMLTGDTSPLVDDRLRISNDLFDMNPYSRTSFTSPVYPTSFSTVASSDKLVLKSVSCRFGVLSMTTVAQRVKIIWCTPKSDSNSSPIDCVFGSATRMGQGQVSQVPPNDVIDVLATAGAETYNHWGMDSLKVRDFQKAWRVLKVYDLILQPGDQHHLNVNFVYNSIISRSELIQQNYQYKKNLTIVPLVQAYAGMVTITDLESTPAFPKVSYAGCKVGILNDYTYHLAAVGEERIETNRAFTGIIINNAGVDKQMIIDDDDEIVEKVDIQ